MPTVNSKNSLIVLSFELLLLVCLFGLYSSGDTYAKYTTQISGSSQAAEIAMSILTVSSVTNVDELAFDEENSGTYKFVVENYKTISGVKYYSEARMTYAVYVDVPASSIVVPTGLRTSNYADFTAVTDIANLQTEIIDNADGSKTYKYSGKDMKFMGATHVRRYLIMLAATDGEGGTMSGDATLSVRVVATQID